MLWGWKRRETNDGLESAIVIWGGRTGLDGTQMVERVVVGWIIRDGSTRVVFIAGRI